MLLHIYLPITLIGYMQCKRKRKTLIGNQATNELGRATQPLGNPCPPAHHLPRRPESPTPTPAYHKSPPRRWYGGAVLPVLQTPGGSSGRRTDLLPVLQTLRGEGGSAVSRSRPPAAAPRTGQCGDQRWILRDSVSSLFIYFVEIKGEKKIMIADALKYVSL